MARKQANVMMIKLSKKKKKKRKEGLTNSSGEELAGRSVESPHTRVITEWRVGP